MHRIAVGLASILLLVGCSSSATQPSGSPAPSPSATSAATSAAAFAQATPAPSEVAAAKTAVDAYTRALIGGDWAAAYAALAPESRAHWGSLANYTHDREAFFKTVAGRYMVKQPAADFGLPISMWQPAMYGAALDYSHAVLVEVDYPALAGNNAGYNLYVVQPTPSGLAIFDEDLPIWKPTPRIPARFVLDRFAPTLAEVDWARASGWFDAATIEQLAAATDDSQADLPDARRWLWLALAWLYEHRGEYADPWSEVEALWEAFDHAHELSGLIRWMPRQPGRPAGMDAMTERWRRLVEASSPPNDIRE